MSGPHRGLVVTLLLALSALGAPARAANSGDLVVGKQLIMGGFFYTCEWACVVTRLATGEWTVVDQRGGWVHKEPVIFIPDP
jgi:hypothetical protein